MRRGQPARRLHKDIEICPVDFGYRFVIDEFLEKKKKWSDEEWLTMDDKGERVMEQAGISVQSVNGKDLIFYVAQCTDKERF